MHAQHACSKHALKLLQALKRCPLACCTVRRRGTSYHAEALFIPRVPVSGMRFLVSSPIGMMPNRYRRRASCWSPRLTLVALAAAHVAIRGAAADEPDDWEDEGGEEAAFSQ
eukprot:scaffold42891_cov68-Phaeocystis_antarctica.AAC.2